ARRGAYFPEDAVGRRSDRLFDPRFYRDPADQRRRHNVSAWRRRRRHLVGALGVELRISRARPALDRPRPPRAPAADDLALPHPRPTALARTVHPRPVISNQEKPAVSPSRRPGGSTLAP